MGSIIHIYVDVLLTESCPTLCDPMDCSPPDPLSLEFSRQEYWCGLLFPSSGDPPNPGIEPRPPALEADSLWSERPGKHVCVCVCKGVYSIQEEN